MLEDEFHKQFFVLLELVLLNVPKVEARAKVIRFVDKGLGERDQLFEVNPHKQSLPPLPDGTTELVEHGPNTAEGHSGFANNDRPEFVNKIRVYILLLLMVELLEQVAGEVEVG